MPLRIHQRRFLQKAVSESVLGMATLSHQSSGLLRYQNYMDKIELKHRLEDRPLVRLHNQMQH